MKKHESATIKDKAQCLDMCPLGERRERTEEMVCAQDNFELTQLRDGFEELAVKRFGRPAADKTRNIPDDVRSPLILFHVVSYIRDCLTDQDRIPEG